MIDFDPDFTEDLERTQHLPALTAEVRLDETLQRERAAQLRIVELMRDNLQQAKELEYLRSRPIEVLFPNSSPFTPTIEPEVSADEKFFEACGALKDALWKVLDECEMRGLALECMAAASRTLQESCCQLEQIFRAPALSVPPARHTGTVLMFPVVETSRTAELTS